MYIATLIGKGSQALEGSKTVLSFNYVIAPLVQVHDQGKLPPGIVKVKPLIRTENSKPKS